MSALAEVNYTQMKDRLQGYIMGKLQEVELHDGDYEVYLQCTFADEQLRRKIAPEVVREMLMKRYVEMSKTTAFRRVKLTMELFGQIEDAERPYYRKLVLAWAVDVLKKAMMAGDVRGMNAAIGNLTKITGADRDDHTMMNLEDLQPHKLVIQFDPASLGLEPVNVKTLNHLLHKYDKPQAIDFEEVDVDEA